MLEDTEANNGKTGRGTPPRGRWWVLAVAVCLAVVGGRLFLTGAGAQSGKPQAGGPGGSPPKASVAVETAKRLDIPVYLSGLGTVTPMNSVIVRTRVDGQLMEFRFQEGQLVTKGQVLALIDPRPYEVQLTQAQGQMARDQALLQNARVDLKRYRELWEQNSIPRQQLDTQESLVRQYEAGVKADQGSIDAARLQLTYCRITAPVSGRVGLQLVDPGNIVHASDANGLVVLNQVQPITVLFSLPEDNLPAILARLRQTQRLPVEVYDRDMRNKLADGQLLTLDNQIDQTTGTVRLKAVVPNGGNELFPNQFVNARLLVDLLKSVVVVPTPAIQRTSQGASVYVVKDDGTVESRRVVLGVASGGETVVAKGIEAGEVVVVDGADRLRQGAPVEIRKPAAPGGTAGSSGTVVQGGQAGAGAKQ